MKATLPKYFYKDGQRMRHCQGGAIYSTKTYADPSAGQHRDVVSLN